MTARHPDPDAGCPCGRSSSFGGVLTYARCCGRYLDDPGTPTPDAESLMRSRYTAYALRRDDYVLATWDESTRPAALRIDPALLWTGLRVLSARTTGPDTAEVTFEAGYTERGGRTDRLRERSRFTRREGRWTYRDGSVT